MDDLTIALQLVAIELGVLISGLLVAIIVMFSRRYRAHRRSARTLINRLKDHRPQREQRRRELLQQISVLNEDLVKEGLDDLIRRENTVFARILNALTGDNSQGLEHLDEDIHGLVAGYLALVADGVNPRASGRDELLVKLRDEINNMSARYRELKEDNARLEGELAEVTREYQKLYERERLRQEQHKRAP